MKTDIWMPIIIGDYLKDTRHLDTEEHGAYFLILMDLWVNDGWIPLKILYRVALVSKSEWNEKIWPSLEEFFRIEGKMVTQDRLLVELTKSKNNRRKATLASNKRWEKHRTDNQTDNQRDMRNASSSPSPIPAGKKILEDGLLQNELSMKKTDNNNTEK